MPVVFALPILEEAKTWVCVGYLPLARLLRV
jgi:hypothetical protein